MKERVVTALVLIPLVLAALFARVDWPILGLAAVVYVIGLTEIARMLDDRKGTYVGGVLIPALVVLAILGSEQKLAQFDMRVSAIFWLSLWWIGVFWILALLPRPSEGRGFLAICWLLAPLGALLLLHGLGPSKDGWLFATPVLLAMVPLWGGDTAAIFAGRAWGKHKLAPAISPKKTWEGAIANLLACIAVAIPLAIWIGYSWPIGLACGLAAGILGQAGDLFESYVKRKADLKDSGTLLPGHGGIMDRIDSILFTAPAVAVILTVASRS